MPLLKRKVQSRATLSEQTDDAVNRLLRGLVQASEPLLNSSVTMISVATNSIYS